MVFCILPLIKMAMKGMKGGPGQGNNNSQQGNPNCPWAQGDQNHRCDMRCQQPLPYGGGGYGYPQYGVQQQMGYPSSTPSPMLSQPQAAHYPPPSGTPPGYGQGYKQ
ncbi:DUF580-domain-containing protein [Pseudohyphozyma bogoriensis]|nr:DUF580-domain-containing protein [Pseudohyphozyma bogoriensis]